MEKIVFECSFKKKNKKLLSCAYGSLSQERHPGDSKNYNECIRHETMRVAVCDMLEGKVACPEALWWDEHNNPTYLKYLSTLFPSLIFSLSSLFANLVGACFLFFPRSVMEKSFLEYYDFYEGVCKERLHLQGQNMQVIYLFQS